MKFRYDKEDDVLMIWFSKDQIDYAEQTKDVIVHFSSKNKPVLMEILDASAFIQQTSRILPQKIKQQIFA